MKKINYLLTGLAAVALNMGVVLAQAIPPPTDIPSLPTRTWSLTDIYGWPTLIFNWFFWIITIFTVWMILRTAFDFVKSGGDTNKIKELSPRAMNIVIGIALAVLARSIPSIIAAFITGR
jgi:hypothetical protein